MRDISRQVRQSSAQNSPRLTDSRQGLSFGYTLHLSKVTWPLAKALNGELNMVPKCVKNR